MGIIQKRKLVTSAFFTIGTLFIAASVYLLELGNSKTGAISGILGGFSLVSGVYFHGWLELNNMLHIKTLVDRELEER